MEKQEETTYAFSNKEMYIIRDALIEYYQFLKSAQKGNNTTAKDLRLDVLALKDQFKQDCMLLRR